MVAIYNGRQFPSADLAAWAKVASGTTNNIGRYSGARGVVAFLLFLLPKPSDEAEQRQQMVPRAHSVGRELLIRAHRLYLVPRTCPCICRAAESPAENGRDPAVSRASASFQPVDRLNVVHAAIVPLVAKPSASRLRQFVE